MGNQHVTKVYNSTDEKVLVRIEHSTNLINKYEIASGEYITQPTQNDCDVIVKLFIKNKEGLWNENHVTKSINPSDVNLIVKKKSKTYSFVRSKYGNVYAESSSPS